jgi:hypothetical protein
LLSWTQDAVVTVPQLQPEAKPKRKHTLLPVLVVLFLISYGLMSMLAVEQDRTIASQRSLITALLSDSTELSNLKGKLFQKQYAEAQAQAKAGASSQAQTPLSGIPMTPMTQTPMTQDTPGGTEQPQCKQSQQGASTEAAARHFGRCGRTQDREDDLNFKGQAKR